MSATQTPTNLRLVSPDRAEGWGDEEIKQLAEDNQRMAMDMAVRKYRERLFYHAFYITKDSQEAYDVVQEVFIRAMRERRFFNEDFRIKAWLFRVTSNLCFNLVRDRRRRGVILESTPRADSTPADQIEVVFQGERRAEMLEAIDKMTDAHREILMLRYYNDLSYAEIADVLDVKLGTVMSRLSRARGRLLEVVGEDSRPTP